jgi:hypothetical protein
MQPTVQEMKQRNQIVVLHEEVMPTVSSAVNIFKNAPVGTKDIRLTVESKSIRLTYLSHLTPTTTVGELIAAGGPYTLDLDYEQAQKVKGIETAATAGGRIVYRGVR